MTTIPAFLDELADLRFTGEIVAMPEGTIAFPNEPLLRVTAPFREAILMEAGLLQAINLATLIATKAARVVWAAQGAASRSSPSAGRRIRWWWRGRRTSAAATSTSLLAAAFEYRLLATGTVPHALIQLFETEEDAFTAVAESFNRYTLLLDTYDPRRAIHTAIDGGAPGAGRAWAIRWPPSGWIAAIWWPIASTCASSWSRRAWAACASSPAATWTSSRSSELLEAGAEVDAFGVGTALGAGVGRPRAGHPWRRAGRRLQRGVVCG